MPQKHEITKNDLVVLCFCGLNFFGLWFQKLSFNYNNFFYSLFHTCLVIKKVGAR